jgi:putative Mg2+ transporter-C (MgtC) family protein
MSVEPEWAALSMAAAIVCGCIIGLERQARQQTAGVRTNALVALGASSFVIFSQIFPGDVNQARIAGQIITGVGFLGAGLIFRDGMKLKGINTAATLWCSAAVGMMCGVGYYHLAAILTAMVLILNLFLRPVINLLDARLLRGRVAFRNVRLRLVCRSDREEELRALALRMLVQAGYRLVEMDSHPAEDGSGVEVIMLLGGPEGTEEALEKTLALLAVEPGVTHVDGELIDNEG